MSSEVKEDITAEEAAMGEALQVADAGASADESVEAGGQGDELELDTKEASHEDIGTSTQEPTQADLEVISSYTEFHGQGNAEQEQAAPENDAVHEQASRPAAVSRSASQQSQGNKAISDTVEQESSPEQVDDSAVTVQQTIRPVSASSSSVMSSRPATAASSLPLGQLQSTDPASIQQNDMAVGEQQQLVGVNLQPASPGLEFVAGHEPAKIASQLTSACGVTNQDAAVSAAAALQTPSVGSSFKGQPAGNASLLAATDSKRAVDVQIDQGPDQPPFMLRVYMDCSQQDRKPYLGGFRNKHNGVTYHHACTQTPKVPKHAGKEPKLERQTQTVIIKTRGQQTVREASTQMERPGCLIETSGDTERIPGRYQTSEERLAIVEAATRCIQRWARGWMGRRRAAHLRAKKAEREMFLQTQEFEAHQKAQERRRKEIERRMHPKTAADFEILYNELQAWRLQETQKIKGAGLDADKEHELLQQLLHKETKLLQTIDRLKINANHENKDKRVQHMLGDMSKPKHFELRDGRKVEVHTAFTTRAKELMQLYNGLNLPMLSLDERLDVLLHVKWTVKEFDCNLTREIVALIDREADLLNRGRNASTMEGLRRRIASLFLNFIETPEFNPEASRHQVVPKDFQRYCFEKLETSTAETHVTVTARSKWDA